MNVTKFYIVQNTVSNDGRSVTERKVCFNILSILAEEKYYDLVEFYAGKVEETVGFALDGEGFEDNGILSVGYDMPDGEEATESDMMSIAEKFRSWFMDNGVGCSQPTYSIMEIPAC
jgi:hypothetical protein